jgi:outer membrane protein OmpA-like peptidoglycan-associated protein
MHYRHALLLAAFFISHAALAQFTIRLGIYPNQIGSEYFTEKGWHLDIQELKHEDGYYHYHSGQFKTWTEAEITLAKARRMAWQSATIIDLEEAEVLKTHPCPYMLEQLPGALNTFYLPFDARSLSLSPQVKGMLKDIVEIMKTNQNVVIQVTGHTDNEGDALANLEIAGNRARVIRDHLMQIHHIPSARIFTKAAGESSPLLPNANEFQCINRQNQIINNRVTITVRLAGD